MSDIQIFDLTPILDCNRITELLDFFQPIDNVFIHFAPILYTGLPMAMPPRKEDFYRKQDYPYPPLRGRVEKREKWYKRNPLINRYSPNLSSPHHAPPWDKFFRQQEALDRAHTDPNGELKVFSVEDPDPNAPPGRRQFIVASYEEFCFYYKQIRSEDRHYYEIIEEDARCHLYFDLEFSKVENPDLNGEELIAKFQDYVFEKVEAKFDVKISKKHVLDLDSTSVSKFSRHLIVHIPNIVFRCNQDVGAFVRKICDDSGDEFFVRTSNGVSSFVDTGVYTRNRNFRLYLSSKKGKSAFLMKHKGCEFDFSHHDIRSACCVHHVPNHKSVVNPAPIDICERIFYASLITNVKNPDDMKVVTFESAVTPKKSSSRVIAGYTGTKTCPESPFPMLQNFVTTLVNTDETQGHVNKHIYFPDSRHVIFEITGNRFCRNIGRHHKSNGIYYVCDLTEKRCYQKCHDPDCTGYRSAPVVIPSDVLASSLEIVDDLDLVSEVEDLEKQHRDM